MKKNSMRVMIAVALSVIALSMAGTPAAAGSGGSGGGIGGILKVPTLTISK